MDKVIRSEGLSKLYRLGSGAHTYGRLTESMSNALKAPFRMLHRRHNGPPVDEDLWALKDVSFDVEDGQAVGIIGRNGVGQTELLTLLLPVTKPPGGRAGGRGTGGA